MAKALWLLEMLFPRIGKRPIREVTPPELLAALRKIEARGHHETAHRAKQKCGQVFRYAIGSVQKLQVNGCCSKFVVICFEADMLKSPLF
jgi:integrase